MITPRPWIDSEERLLRLLKLLSEQERWDKELLRKRKRKFTASLEKHTVLTSILCVVRHKHLFEDMKQLHKQNKSVNLCVVTGSTGVIVV